MMLVHRVVSILRRGAQAVNRRTVRVATCSVGSRLTNKARTELFLLSSCHLEEAHLRRLSCLGLIVGAIDEIGCGIEGSDRALSHRSLTRIHCLELRNTVAAYHLTLFVVSLRLIHETSAVLRRGYHLSLGVRGAVWLLANSCEFLLVKLL